jgi:hypothetical protein
MSFKKFTDEDGVVLRSTDVSIEDKVFRYEAGVKKSASRGMEDLVNSNPIGCSEGHLVSVRNDSDGYCSWLETLTGD